MEYKDFNITGTGTFPGKVIKKIGKGAIPKTLRGLFTSEVQVKRAIDLSLELSQPKKEEKTNAKKTSSTRAK